MKRLFALAAAMLLFVGAAGAQTYFNVGYGQNTSIDKSELYSNPSLSNRVFAGVSHNFRFGDFVGLEVGGDFVYDFRRSEYSNFLESLSSAERTWVMKTHYMGVQVPVLFNYKLALSRDLAFKFFVGPTFHYGLKNTVTAYYKGVKEHTTDMYALEFDRGYNRFYVSASAALAMEVAEAFRIKVGYDYGLTNTYENDGRTVKQHVLNFSMAYMF